MSLSNKVAIVTGASSGIGAAIAQVLAREGATLALVGRNVANLEATKKNLKGAKAEIVVADVTKDADAIVEQTLAKFGRIDVLVNNAGILGKGGLIDLDIAEFDSVINTNLRGVILLTKAVRSQCPPAGDPERLIFAGRR